MKFIFSSYGCWTFVVRSETNCQRLLGSIRHYGGNNKFKVPYIESKGIFILLDKMFFLFFFRPLPPAGAGYMQSELKKNKKSALRHIHCSKDLKEHRTIFHISQC